MQPVTVRLPLLLLLLLLLPLTSAASEMEVIKHSSPCSVTCGLGVKTQTICFLKDGQHATVEKERAEDGDEVSDTCRVRKVKCKESWRCSLRTFTVTTGEKLDIDCLGEVMKAMGKYSWRLSWRYARGIISSNDFLFARWKAPLLGRLLLDPVREEDAGTYRCDVQDAALRRVKRAYWGVRVLPAGSLDLDYDSANTQWQWTGKHQNVTVASDQWYPRETLLNVGLSSFCVAAAVAAVTLLVLYWTVRKRGMRRGGDGADKDRVEDPHQSEGPQPERGATSRFLTRAENENQTCS